MAMATKVEGFDVLCSNLELDNFTEMEKSAKTIAKKLNSVYYGEDSDDTSHLYIVGSVGRKTAIKGSSDRNAPRTISPAARLRAGRTRRMTARPLASSFSPSAKSCLA